MAKAPNGGTRTPELDQLAIALALGKFAHVLKLSLARENAEHQEKLALGVNFALMRLGVYGQCFAPGHPEHPFPVEGNPMWLASVSTPSDKHGESIGRVLSGRGREPPNKSKLAEQVLKLRIAISAQSLSAISGASATQCGSLLAYMTRKGELERIGRGVYRVKINQEESA